MDDLGRLRSGPSDTEALAREARAAELRYRSLLNASRDGLAVLRNGRIVHANPALLALLGLERPGQLAGQSLVDHVAPQDRERAVTHLGHVAVATGGAIQPPIAVRLCPAAGAPTWVEWWARPMDHSGAPTLLVGVRDGGERLRLQRALEESERLAGLGALAAGVAHDAVNPLSYALLGLECLVEECTAGTPDPAVLLERLQEALDGVRRVSEVIGDLQAYAANEQQAPTRVLIPQALDTALGVALHRLRHHARVDWERGRADLATLAPEGALVRLIVDLLVQASQVFEHPDPARNRLLVRTGEGPHGPWIEVESRAHLRALTPTLPGLLVHGVRHMGASLAPTLSAEGHHRLRLVLPTPPQPALQPATAGPVARLRVLLVDDEPLICRALSLGLERTCTVTTFTRGQDALDHLAQGHEHDVVLLDVMMDTPAGPEIWAWLNVNRPTWMDRVVFITGGAATETARQLLAGTQADVIAKPIDLVKLRKRVARIGARTRGAAGC